jgi:N-acetyltransferase
MTIPEGRILETEKVILRPIAEEDFEELFQLAQDDEEAWKYFTLRLADRDHLRKWMDAAYTDRKNGTRRPFTIIEKSSGKIAGSSSMGNISYPDFRLEIGWSWLGKKFRGSGINFHTKFAMMNHAFEQLQFERVEFKTDFLNERAKQGLRKIGGKEEGVLRSHMTMWNDRRRDSIYFAVLKNEWPALKETVFKDVKGYAFH